MRPIARLGLIGAALCVVCWTAEHAFFADVVPIADSRDQPIGPLETAFLLRSLEYLGLSVAALSLLAIVAFKLKERSSRH